MKYFYSKNNRIIKESFRNFAFLARLILSVILPGSILSGIIFLLLINNIKDGVFWITIDNLLGSPMVTAMLVYSISNLLLTTFWIAALLYIMNQTRQGERLTYAKVLKNGFWRWRKVIILAFIAAFIIHGPSYILGLTYGIVNWAIYPLMVWMIVATIFLVWKYALVLPAYVTEDTDIVTAIKRGAYLSAGRRGEIMFILFVFLFLAVVVSTLFSALFSRLMMQINLPQYILMAIAAGSSILLECLLFSLPVIAVFLIYKEQASALIIGE